MTRGIKQKSGSGDSGIQDAAERAKIHKAKLEETSGYSSPNETDLLSEQLDQGNESESIRSVFED